MARPIHVEAAPERRRDFARWCLSQSPRLETASATGTDVPAELFKDLPGDLLDGALVDGHVYRHVIEGKVPDGDGYADEPVEEAAEEPAQEAAPVTRSRRKPVSK